MNIKELLKNIEDNIKVYKIASKPYNSLVWYKNRVKKLVQSKTNNKKVLAQTPAIGKMFLLSYLPKNKNTLKYYDTFPLIFIIGFKSNGFLGINLHYLPLKERENLLKSLLNIGLNNSKMDETTKVLLSYELLSTYSKSHIVKPTIKYYLYNKIRNFHLVYPEDWVYTSFMPLESFMKESKENVWKDSRKIIKDSK